jgi:hypothetical protein
MIEVGASLPQIAQDLTVNLSSIAGNSVSQETTAVVGVTPYQTFSLAAPALEAGLVLLGAGCTTAGTLIISVWNTTSAAINPASQSFKLVAH